MAPGRPAPPSAHNRFVASRILKRRAPTRRGDEKRTKEILMVSGEDDKIRYPTPQPTPIAGQTSRSRQTIRNPRRFGHRQFAPERIANPFRPPESPSLAHPLTPPSTHDHPARPDST